MNNKEANLMIWNKMKNNISPFLQLFAMITTFVTGAFCLQLALENYIRSILWDVDCSLYQIDFNLYKILLWYISFFLCYQITSTIWTVLKSIVKRIRKQKVNPLTLEKKVLFIIILILLIVFGYFSFLDTLIILSFILMIGGLISIIFWILKKVDKIEAAKEVDSAFSLRSYIIEGLNIMGITLILIIVVNIASIYCSIINCKKFNLLYFDDHIEVIIEAYEDYYITKKAYIVENELHILKNTQNILSANGNIATHQEFERLKFVEK